MRDQNPYRRTARRARGQPSGAAPPGAGSTPVEPGSPAAVPPSPSAVDRERWATPAHTPADFEAADAWGIPTGTDWASDSDGEGDGNGDSDGNEPGRSQGRDQACGQGQEGDAGHQPRQTDWQDLNSDAAMAISDETHGGVRPANGQEAAMPTANWACGDLPDRTGPARPTSTSTSTTSDVSDRAREMARGRAVRYDDATAMARGQTAEGHDDAGDQARGQAVQQDDSMQELKWEVAGQLGLADDLQDPDELTVREAGRVGGNMVRRLIERGKQSMAKEQGEDNPGGSDSAGGSRPTPR